MCGTDWNMNNTGREYYIRGTGFFLQFLTVLTNLLPVFTSVVYEVCCVRFEVNLVWVRIRKDKKYRTK